MEKIYKSTVSLKSFKIYAVILMFLKSIPLFNNGLHLVSTGLTLFAALWGMYILVTDFYTKQVYFFNKYFLFYILFSLSYVITIIFNYKYALIDNIQDLIWFSISFLLLFAPTEVNNEQKSKQDFYSLLKLYLFISLIVSFISIFFVFLKKGGNSDQLGIWGFHMNRLWGLYRSPNYGSVFCVISLCISLFFILKNNFVKVHKGFLYSNIIIQFMYIIYSGSNTGKISLITCISVFLLYYIITAKSNRQRFLNILLSFLIIFCVFGLANILIETTTCLMNSIYAGDNLPQDSLADSSEIDGESSFSLDRPDLNNDPEIGNGRLFNWTIALTVFKNYVPFGTSMRGYNYISKQYDHSWRTMSDVRTIENDFVSLIVCTGVIGTVLMVLLMVFILKDIIKYIVENLKNKNIENIDKILLPFTIVLSISVSMFFTDAVIFANALQALMFYICLGYVVQVISTKEKKVSNENFFRKKLFFK